MESYRNSNINKDITNVLSYCDISQYNLRRDAYNHWYRYIEVCIKYNGMNFESLNKRLRGSVGIDFRYLDAMRDTFIEYGVIKLDNNIMVYIGIPDGSIIEIKEPEKPKSKFMPLDKTLYDRLNYVEKAEYKKNIRKFNRNLKEKSNPVEKMSPQQVADYHNDKSEKSD